jgi:anthranilate synthase component 1
MKLRSSCTTVLSDLTSPVAVYSRVRDRYPNSFLLESSDFHGADDCRSFICCDPIAEFRVENFICTVSEQGQQVERKELSDSASLATALEGFIARFQVETSMLPKGVVNGAFGFVAWDAVQLMEKIRFTRREEQPFSTPMAQFFVFRYVLAFNHFRNEAHVMHNEVDGHDDCATFLRHAFDGPVRTYPFKRRGAESAVLSDDRFQEIISQLQKHIGRGDIFQVVPSNRYMQPFEGDEFQVYRALRSVNPSPYLFFCDFGGFRLLGSSPEAQIVVRDGQASVFPIAGTYPRSGDDTLDREQAEKLLEDPKENAEHSMLVDLGRNDLSKHCSGVRVAKYREVQYFSHVIHLVSEVTGRLASGVSAARIMCDSFPAGTLSGAPKHMAMTLIDRYEPSSRGFYGGCVGFLGFNGDAVFGIVIRSFMSQKGTLFYQAGMGITHGSVPESEVKEGHAKMGALRAALQRAEAL